MTAVHVWVLVGHAWVGVRVRARVRAKGKGRMAGCGGTSVRVSSLCAGVRACGQAWVVAERVSLRTHDAMCVYYTFRHGLPHTARGR